MCRGPCSYCGSPQVLVEHPKAPHPLGMFNLTQHLHCHRSFVLYMAVHTGQGEGAVRKCEILQNMGLFAVTNGLLLEDFCVISGSHEVTLAVLCQSGLIRAVPDS